MDAMKEYNIEFVKLTLGDHKFEYHLTDEFFKAFNSSLLSEDIHVSLLFQKSATMFTLVFELKGKLGLECDRCLSHMALPVKGKHTVLVKITDYPMENEDDLIYLGSHEYKLNIAQHLYDFVCLAVPIKKTCEDVGKTCDPLMTSNITSIIDIENGDRLPDRDSDEEDEEEEQL